MVLLRQHALGLLLAEDDVVNGVSLVLEGDVVAIKIGGDEDF